MKMKKVMMMLVIMMAGFMIMPNVNAEYKFDTPNFDKNIKQEGQGTKENPYILTLQEDAIQDIVIEDGANLYVVIDLAGHKLTNYTQDNSVIHIKDSNSSITIKDSSNGSGVIELNKEKSITGAVPVIKNEGTLIDEGGTINSNNDSGERSTGIYNVGNLTITGGTIKTESDDAWGITNLGTTVINGGTFNQNKKLPMIQNSADLTINNGTFQASGAPGQEAMIVNDPGDEGKEGNIIAKIAGGDFQTQNVIYEEGKATTEVSGGTYQNPESIVKYLANGYELENGKIVKVEQPVAPAEEKNPDTSDINLFMLISFTVLSGLGLGYAVKKRRFN